MTGLLAGYSSLTADQHINLWIALGTWIAAAGSLAVVFIAKSAARDWMRTLKQQRGDEAVEAAHDCAAAIGRAISRKQKGLQLTAGTAYQDEAWVNWSRLRVRYAVAKRYYSSARDGLIEDGEKIMEALNGYCGAPSVTREDGSKINIAFGQLRKRMESTLLH